MRHGRDKSRTLEFGLSGDPPEQSRELDDGGPARARTRAPEAGDGYNVAVSLIRETSGRDAGTPTAESTPPKRLTRDTRFIVTSVLVVGGLILLQRYLLGARLEDTNQHFENTNQHSEDINRRIDDLDKRVNKRIDDLHDDVREIRSMVLRYLAQRSSEGLGSPEPAKPAGDDPAATGQQSSSHLR